VTETGEREPLGRALAGMRPFLLLWAGQLVSGLGSGLTGFALPVWVYQRTGSAEAFGLLFFAATAPAVLVAPLAGAIVDRSDRRRVLIATDAASAVLTAGIAVLVLTGSFRLWHLMAMSAAASALGSFQYPAFAAAMGALVPKRHYTRAAGLLQSGDAAVGILTPLLAGVLVTTVGLAGVIAIDVATFLVAVTTLVLVRIPPVEPVEGPRPALWADAREGWRFVRARPGLLLLLLYFPVVNLGSGMIHPLFGPLVLSFATPAEMGALLSFASVGMLIGGLALGVWGGPERRVRGLVVGQALVCVCLAVVGLRPSLPLVGAGLFLSFLLAPAAQACSQSIWLSKTPRAMMGRVFAIRRMLAMSTTPIAALASGPLAERVFNPLLLPGGALAESVGRVLGTGPGRGIGLMFVLIAAFVLAATGALYLSPRVRRLEDEIPDAAPAGA
jgi:MFS transporter, DHA3 family, macrolide efflux protein